MSSLEALHCCVASIFTRRGQSQSTRTRIPYTIFTCVFFIWWMQIYSEWSEIYNIWWIAETELAYFMVYLTLDGNVRYDRNKRHWVRWKERGTFIQTPHLYSWAGSIVVFFLLYIVLATAAIVDDLFSRSKTSGLNKFASHKMQTDVICGITYCVSSRLYMCM